MGGEGGDGEQEVERVRDDLLRERRSRGCEKR